MSERAMRAYEMASRKHGGVMRDLADSDGVDLYELFQKYIRYVRDSEGIDFITIQGGGSSDVRFTDAEWGVLERLATDDEGR